MNKTQSLSKNFVAQRIHYMRKEANMSYEELSQKSGVSIKHLKQFETSAFGKLPAVELAYVCDTFGVSINALFKNMSFDEFKETYHHQKQFSKLPEKMQKAFVETMCEVPLSDHTDQEFIEALFRKVTDGDEEAYQKSLSDFWSSYKN